MSSSATSVVLGVLTWNVSALVAGGDGTSLAGEKPPTTTRVYISASADAEGDGIYLAELHRESGALGLMRRAAEVKKASYLAFHPGHGCLYGTCAIDEYADSQGGALSAWRIDRGTGDLKLLNHQPSAGAGPCFVSLDREGRYAFVANYDGGNVAILPIGHDGHLGPATATVGSHGSSINRARQSGPHPHGIHADPANRFLFVPDLGIDRILAFRFDDVVGTLAPNEPGGTSTRAGAGPRHLVFHPNGKWAYVINELDSTVSAMRYDAARGVMTTIEVVSTLPAGVAGDNITGEIMIHPNGRFLYGSNRGDDSIALFAIDRTTGRLTLLGHYPAGGRTPRHFNIDPTGHFLLSANLDSDSVTVQRIDAGSGALLLTSHEIEIRSPLCIEFAP